MFTSFKLLFAEPQLVGTGCCGEQVGRKKLAKLLTKSRGPLLVAQHFPIAWCTGGSYFWAQHSSHKVL